jgi:hypothetical protein
MIINEFIQLFEIHENKTMEIPNKKNKKMENSSLDSKESLDNGEKGIQCNDVQLYIV